MADVGWYYAVNNQRAGPVPFAELQRLAAQGHVGPGDLVWREGMADWLPASTVPGLTPPPPPVPPLPRYAATYGGYEDRQPPGHQWPGPIGQSYQGMAIAGFVLSLTMVPLGFIFSLVALLGMRRTGNSDGKGLAIAGLTVSGIAIGAFCFWMGAMWTCALAGVRGF